MNEFIDEAAAEIAKSLYEVVTVHDELETELTDEELMKLVLDRAKEILIAAQ